MDSQAIQKLIDAEKPAFDYARMFLTTVAWWTIFLFIAGVGFRNDSFRVAALFGLPILIVAGLFGIFLGYRLNLLTERVAEILIDNIGSVPAILRPFLRIVFALLPGASACLLVWALMFTEYGK